MCVCVCVIYPLYSADTQWAYQWVLFDRDGTLTGQKPGSKVVSYSPIYNPEWCVESDLWSNSYRGMICSPEAKFVLFAYNRAEPEESLFQQDIYLETVHGGHRVPFSGNTNARKGWSTVLPTGIMNKISYPEFPGITDVYYNAKFLELEVSDIFF